MKKARLNIQNRLEKSESINTEDRIRFYSNYYYGAIHVLSSIPEFRTTEKIAEALHLSRNQAQEIIDFLIRLGVLIEKKGELSPGPRHVHIGNDSELVLKHHANWRLHTLSNLQFIDTEDVHYSACMSLSIEDAHRIKEILLSALKSNVDIATKSTDEIAYVLGIDFYKLLR